MPTVTFDMKKSDGTDATVELIRRGGSPRIRLSFDSGSASAEVDTGVAYTVAWELIGQIGNTISVTWSSGAAGGAAATGFISAGNSIALPGDRHRTQGMGSLPAIGG